MYSSSHYKLNAIDMDVRVKYHGHPTRTTLMHVVCVIDRSVSLTGDKLYLFQQKMSEKQTTFFTINCAENLESPNQCFSLPFSVKKCLKNKQHFSP
jgi:hypothetical protein